MVRRYWDISLPLGPGLPVWPGDPAVEMAPVASVARGDPCNVTGYRFGSHTGTHVDPPRHFFDEGAPLADLPLDAFLGPCIVADLSAVRRSIVGGDLDRAGIPAGTERLLLKTRNSRLWADPCHAFDPGFVDLSVEGARWIIDRGIGFVGIDYLSIEGPGNPTCPVHRSLLSASIIIVEGLDLREVPPGAYELVCLPLRAMNGDGAPARALLRETG